jgi:hypothetical protein
MNSDLIKMIENGPILENLPIARYQCNCGGFPHTRGCIAVLKGTEKCWPPEDLPEEERERLRNFGE